MNQKTFFITMGLLFFCTAMVSADTVYLNESINGKTKIVGKITRITEYEVQMKDSGGYAYTFPRSFVSKILRDGESQYEALNKPLPSIKVQNDIVYLKNRNKFEGILKSKGAIYSSGSYRKEMISINIDSGNSFRTKSFFPADVEKIQISAKPKAILHIKSWHSPYLQGHKKIKGVIFRYDEKYVGIKVDKKINGKDQLLLGRSSIERIEEKGYTKSETIIP